MFVIFKPKFFDDPYHVIAIEIRISKTFIDKLLLRYVSILQENWIFKVIKYNKSENHCYSSTNS